MKPSDSTPRKAWLIAALLAIATQAQAAPGSRPLKASLDLEQRTGRSTVCLGSQGQPGIIGILSGSGHATHFGAVELRGSHCMGFRPNQPINMLNGMMTLTAANGDTVRADYSGLISQLAPGSYAFEASFHIVDGTGRFQEASGSGALFGTMQGEFSPTGQPVSLTAEGRMRF